jgi:hypothetical protein
MLITNAAMIAFAAESGLARYRHLPRCWAAPPTPTTPRTSSRRTAAAISGGQAVVFRGKGHLYRTASKAHPGIVPGFLLGR